ncbi:TPA: hypothetical protein ACXNG6_000191 [Stenotrophomonas maltophilia]
MDAIEKRAREVLADVHAQAGWPGCAKEILLGENKFDILHDLAIAAIIAALTPPEGYVLVPVEPTEAMVDRATWEEVGGHCSSCTAWAASPSDARRVWAAMLAARPEVKP